MSLFETGLGLLGKATTSVASRFFTPKNVVVDINMLPQYFVQENLRKQNLQYHFSSQHKVIAREHDGWRIAIGSKRLVLTEQYVDKRHELILLCKDA